MTIQDVAKKLAEQNKMPVAQKYDMYYREYDDMVEILGLVSDPNYEQKEFEGREMLFPKRWLTIGVLTPEEVYPEVVAAGV